MSTEPSLPALPEAISRWVADKYNYLLGVAYRHLWNKARAASSPESAVHSALQSLLERPPEEVLKAALANDQHRLGRLVVEAVVRHCRKRNKRAERDRIVRPGEAFDPSDPSTGLLSEAEYEKALEDLLSQLTPRQCEVLLAYLAGTPPKQIAALINRSVALVSEELKRVRELLAKA